MRATKARTIRKLYGVAHVREARMSREQKRRFPTARIKAQFASLREQS